MVPDFAVFFFAVYTLLPLMRLLSVINDRCDGIPGKRDSKVFFFSLEFYNFADAKIINYELKKQPALKKNCQ